MEFFLPSPFLICYTYPLSFPSFFAYSLAQLSMHAWRNFLSSQTPTRRHLETSIFSMTERISSSPRRAATAARFVRRFWRGWSLVFLVFFGVERAGRCACGGGGVSGGGDGDGEVGIVSTYLTVLGNCLAAWFLWWFCLLELAFCGFEILRFVGLSLMKTGRVGLLSYTLAEVMIFSPERDAYMSLWRRWQVCGYLRGLQQCSIFFHYCCCYSNLLTTGYTAEESKRKEKEKSKEESQKTIDRWR